MTLSQIDLNLLVVLDTLLKERSASKAAVQLGLTQPAVSNALSRLRELFNDVLFVRGPHGLEPTPRALSVAGSLCQVLSQVESDILATNKFDPHTSEHVFKIASTDYGGVVIGTSLTKALAAAAPRVRLNVVPMRAPDPTPDLANGSFDLALGFKFDERPGLFAKELYRDRFISIVKKNHPALGKTAMSVKKYSELKHVLVAPWGKDGSVVDGELAKLGLTRDVVVRLPSFLVAPTLIAQTDYVATLPERVAMVAGEFLPIEFFEPPLALENFPVSMAWHERTQRDPAQRWLREMVVSTLLKCPLPTQKVRPVRPSKKEHPTLQTWY